MSPQESLIFKMNRLNRMASQCIPDWYKCSRKEVLVEEQPKNEESVRRYAGQVKTALRRTVAERLCETDLSPQNGKCFELPSHNRLSYSYERNIDAAEFENRYSHRIQKQTGRTCPVVLFNCGMAAISVVLEEVFSILGSTKQREVRMLALSSYFESRLLLDRLGKNNGIRIVNSAASTFDLDEIGELDILFLESVIYDLSLSTEFANPRFLSNFHSPPKIVIIDSTLTPEAWGINEFLRKAKIIGVDTVIDLRSAVKLDQAGLELINLGVAEIYHLQESTLFYRFEERLRERRGITGRSLNLFSLACLDYHFILNPKYLYEHEALIAANNARFAMNLYPKMNSGIFKKLHFPGIEMGKMGICPFSIIEMDESATIDDLSLVASVISWEAKRRHTSLTYGGSFGFIFPRFDIIISDKRVNSGFIKVSMGSCWGESGDRIMEIFRELSAFRTIDDLRKRYSGIPLAKLTI